MNNQGGCFASVRLSHMTSPSSHHVYPTALYTARSIARSRHNGQRSKIHCVRSYRLDNSGAERTKLAGKVDRTDKELGWNEARIVQEKNSPRALERLSRMLKISRP